MKASSTKLKEHLTIGLSLAAFALSLASFYVTGLRVTDDLRVVAGEMPYLEPDYEKKEFAIRGLDAGFTFINAGMRSAVITGITLKIAQPEEHRPFPDSGCGMTAVHIVAYDTKSFVMKSGDMLTKNAVLTGSMTVPFSTPNANSKKVHFKLCVDVGFMTPSIEYNVVSINEFEDELDETIGGYVTFGSDKIVERRPVQLIKRSGIVLFD